MCLYSPMDPILIIGLTHLNLKLLICINFAFAENLLERA